MSEVQASTPSAPSTPTTSPVAPLAAPTRPVGAPPINGASPIPPSGEAAKAPEAEAGKPAPEKLTSKFVELTRRERKLAEESKALKESAERAKGYEAARSKAKEDPFSALESLGLTLDELVEAAVKKDRPETIEQKVNRLEAERKAERVAAEKSQADALSQARDASVSNAKKSIHDFIQANAETYELVAAQGHQDEVFDILVSHHAETGELMAPETAAAMVEDYLLDKAVELAKKSKKLSSAFAPKVEAPPVEAPSKVTPSWFTPGKKSTPTLTNSMSGAPAPKAPITQETRAQVLARIAEKHFRK